MKKIKLLAIALASAAILSLLTACDPISMLVLAGLASGGDRTEETTAEDTAELVLTESGEAGDVTEPESEPEETTEEETAPVELVEIGDYKFGVKGGQRAQRGDTYYLIATFLFQNNSDSEASFDWSLDVDAYQNGVELSSASVYWLSGYDSASGNEKHDGGSALDASEWSGSGRTEGGCGRKSNFRCLRRLPDARRYAERSAACRSRRNDQRNGTPADGYCICR